MAPPIQEFQVHRALAEPAALGSRTLRAATRIRVLGHALFCCSGVDASRWIVSEIKSPGSSPFVLAHVNIHNLRVISAVRGLAGILEARASCLLEGIGLKMACVLTNGSWPEDTNGTDLFPAVMDRLGDMPCRVFLLGATTNIVGKAAIKITESWPNAEIVGCRDGFFSHDELPEIVAEVRRVKPDLLLIGAGAPRQELLALEFSKATELKVVWTVGGLFDRLAGRTRRAPRWTRFLRLEFLFRIWLEPRRLTPRYFKDALWLTKRCANEGFERLFSPNR